MNTDSEDADNIILLRPGQDQQRDRVTAALPRSLDEFQPWIDNCLRVLGFIVGPPRTLHHLVRAHRLRLRLVARLGLSLEGTKAFSDYILLDFMQKLGELEDHADAAFAIDRVYGCVFDALGLDSDTGIASDDPEYVDAIGTVELIFPHNRDPDEAFAELRRSLEGSRIRAPRGLLRAVGDAMLSVLLREDLTNERVAAEFLRVNSGRGWTVKKAEDSHYLFEDGEGGRIHTKNWKPIRDRAEKIARNRPRGS